MIHIHNGDVVATYARRAGIAGEHFPFREALIMGPVVPGDDWIETRAQTLAADATELLRVRTDLLEQELFLDNAASRGEVVLWFEHDLFCLIHLLYLLQRFVDKRLSLIWCTKPLSENDERELRLQFESRAVVMPSMTKLAREAWAAYASSDPTALNRFIERDSPEFPFLREGLTLHASRFPSHHNGLGVIEQRALQLIANGIADFGTIFDRINDSARFGFGDSGVFRTLRGLAQRAVPLVTVMGEAPKAMFAITPAGEDVLHGQVDDCAVNDPDAWLGGVHLTKETLWRWDGARIIPSQPAVS